MGSFGATEILLILIVGFILLGPKGLSKLSKMIGSIFGEFSIFKDDIKKTVDEVKDSVNVTSSPVRRRESQKKANDIKKIENKENNEDKKESK